MKYLIKVTVPVLLCSLSFTSGNTQTVKGTVKDTAGKAVPYATVTLKNSASNVVVSYTATDSKGSFALRVTEKDTARNLAIEVRSIGYKESIKNIVNFDEPVDVTLTASVDELQGVVVKSSRPIVSLHGDTMSYNVSEFASPQDRTIGEVLRKLPGITVSANGTISYNNKQISALYIGGDNLLDSKYGIATNTIPQGAVNSVQVIQNEQPVKVLQNKIVGDAVALNLEIKKGAKLRLMGQESIGAGLPGKYDVNLNAMMFKDHYKAINYLAGNNIGNDVERDLASHNSGGNQQQSEKSQPPKLLSLGAGNTPELAQNRYFFNQAGVVSLNNLVNLKKNVQLKANAYYVHDTQKQDYSQQTTIYLPGDTVTYRETQQNRSAPDVLHTQFTLNINRDKYYLNNVLFMDYKNTTSYSGLKTDSSAVDQVYNYRTLNFANEFNLIKSLKSNNIIQFYSYISHSAGPENRVIRPGYNAAIFNNNVPYAQLIQYVNIPNWYANHYFSFKMPLGPVTQSFKTGFSVQSQRLLSDLNIVPNNGGVIKVDSSLNHVNWTNKKWYAEAAYDFPGTVIRANLTLPVSLQQIHYSETLFGLDKNVRRLYVNPQLNIKYQLGTEKYVTFNYSYTNQIGAIENIYPGYILTDYRTLHANSAGLGEQQNQQAVIGFSYRKALKLFFWSIGVLYNHARANNISSSIITNNIQRGIMLPYPNSNDLWMLSGSVSKYSFALHTTFSSVIQWQSSRSVQIQNNVVMPFNTLLTMVNLSAVTKVNNHVNFSYGVTIKQTYSHSKLETTAYEIHQLLQQASVNYSPINTLQLKLVGEHYFTRQSGRPDLQNFFADASLKYKADKWKTDFELSAANFLNVRTYRSLYLSANAFSAGSYTLPGRIILLKMLFNL